MRKTGTTTAPGTRDQRVDFFRGLALVFIFWDHVPDSIFGYLTLRNVGLSDAAEVFVFLAGYSAALAYGKVLRRAGYVVAALKVLRRAWTLYIAHIFIFALLTGVVFVTNAHVETRDFVQDMGLGYFVNDTEQALLAELTLRFKPNLMDPLPLYIVLLVAFAAALPLILKRPRLALVLSLLLYTAALLSGFNLPAQPDGVWFFNPLAWQALFVAGAVAADARLGPNTAALTSRPRLRRGLDVACGLILTAAALLVLSWHRPAWHDAVISPELGAWLYPIDKTDLSPLRFVHFLALAYGVARLCPQGRWCIGPGWRSLTLMGRYPLELFCLGVLLAPLADGLNALADDRLGTQAATALGGLALMVAAAEFLHWSRGKLREPRPASPQPAAAE